MVWQAQNISLLRLERFLILQVALGPSAMSSLFQRNLLVMSFFKVEITGQLWTSLKAWHCSFIGEPLKASLFSVSSSHYSCPEPSSNPCWTPWRWWLAMTLLQSRTCVHWRWWTYEPVENKDIAHLIKEYTSFIGYDAMATKLVTKQHH